jgi:glycosyltransferase involved in cell wall biosynthesis
MYQNRASLWSDRALKLSASQGAVVIVCPGGLENGGGIGRQMGYFLRALDKSGASPSYRLLDSRGPWFLGAAKFWSVLSAGYLAMCMLRLALARFSPTRTITHINITGRGSTLRKLFVVAAAQSVGLRYLLHVHDYDYTADYLRRRKWLQSAVRRMFRGAARVVVLGERDKASLQSTLHLDPAKILVMHNAVPDPQACSAPDVASGPARILFLGYLSDRKGVPELIAALGSPELKRLDWHATLAGGGDAKAYREMAAQHGIDDRIDFPGWLDRAAVEQSCMQAACIVLPSHAEGLAMAVLEGLSHGLAVITTPVGAHAEVIEPEISGLLVPPGDVKALAESLCRVIEDLDLRTRLQQGARRRFLEKFEISAYAKRMSALHSDVLADTEA